jgi:hypothetical protein
LVTAVHVWLDAVLAGCGLVAVILPGGTAAVTDLASSQPVAAVTAAVLVMVAANLLRLLLTAAPELSATIALLEPEAAA